MKKNKKILIGIQERPPLGLGLLLSVQHLLAMMSATILIPMLVGIPVSLALFTSGMGTLIYLVLTKFKVPVYLGSSGAFVSVILVANASLGGIEAAQTGIILVGLSYIAIAAIVSKTGTNWIARMLPSAVVAPLVLIIGLGLAGYAIDQSGLSGGATFKDLIAIFTTLGVVIFFMIRDRGVSKFLPFLLGITAGYLVSIPLGLVDFSAIVEANFFQMPDFRFWAIQSKPTFSAAAFAMLPVILVSISEHIGDHVVLSNICGEEFLSEPGLQRTLLGDGVATLFAGLLGSVPNTSYGENSAVIAATKVGSVYVIAGAAISAILLSFSGIVSAVLYSIPGPVLGAASILLYGTIAYGGFRVIYSSELDLEEKRNTIIMPIMLIRGLGGATIPLWGGATLSGAALAGIVGVALNYILPE